MPRKIDHHHIACSAQLFDRLAQRCIAWRIRRQHTMLRSARRHQPRELPQIQAETRCWTRAAEGFTDLIIAPAERDRVRMAACISGEYDSTVIVIAAQLG